MAGEAEGGREDADHQYKSDLYFDEDDETDLVEYVAPTYRDWIMSPHGRAWWDRVAADTDTPALSTRSPGLLRIGAMKRNSLTLSGSLRPFASAHDFAV